MLNFFRSSGLPLNIPMAIIIQKIIPFDTCGVISTCESTTGNPLLLNIREKVDKVSNLIRLDYNLSYNMLNFNHI